MKILNFEELTSTNDEAMHGEYAHNTIITARRQTAGRGQRGNSWQSVPGENLTFSLVLEPHHIPVVEQYRLSMMAALAASDAVRSIGVECNIKWSNDLYVGDCKIGGILIEHSVMGEMLTRTVIGIGINVRQREFPTTLPNPTSIIKHGVDTTPEALLALFIEFFAERYTQPTEHLHVDYMARLWRHDVSAMYTDSDGRFSARIKEVDPLTGMLTLRTEQGDERQYWFKEVEFLL